MSASSVMKNTLPGIARSSEGPTGGLASVLVRKGPHHAAEPIDADDALAGAWFDAAVQAYGGPVAFAEHIGVDLSYLTKMRSGAKPIAGRHIAKMRGEVDAVLAFVAPLLASIGHVARSVKAPTKADVAAALLDDLNDGSAVTRRMITSATEKRGWTPDQVSMALRGEGEE